MSFKDLGNEEYKRGNWLKAAAMYTKGVKEDPENAVLYSNRSAALLQLKKSGKALEDAEQCIKRRPDWDKGFYRKGLALELADRYPEALDAVVKALACNPSNVEMQRKARDLRKEIGGGSASLTKADKENDGRQQSIKDTEAASQAQQQQPLKVSQPLRDPSAGQDEDLVEFETECIARAVADNTEPEPSVYFLGERAATESVEDATSQVKIKEAFATPDNLRNCVAFLRSYAADKKAQASCAVVPAQQIAYPQVWKKSGWNLEASPRGIFVQLDTVHSRKVWYLPEGAMKDGRVQANTLSEDFSVMERLLR